MTGGSQESVMFRSNRWAACVCIAVAAFVSTAVAGCSSASPTGSSAPSELPTVLTSTETVVLVGAGDIAACNSPGDEATALLLDAIAGTVFTTGDNVYETGTAEEWEKCYGPTWGRHRARTRPSPGNHDFYANNGAAYYEYFGANAGPPGRGYYSYDAGAWKLLSLNSNVPAGVGSAQAAWVAQELKNSRAKCTLAYWHHPVFSSGYEGNMPNMQYVNQLLYEYRAELVVVGHAHNYERFAPQDPSANPNPDRGTRHIVVGTGGNGLTEFVGPKPNSEVFNNDTYGILKLTLAPTSYSWEFIPVAGKTFRDSGSGSCF